ncbi:C40 family peptidase [Streptomyces anandii]|uniref:NlpC/P60 family protein n=1 Tax=Streptomyces anandii TaxID=285454 RepID=A0ABW6H6B1_9ACTN
MSGRVLRLVCTAAVAAQAALAPVGAMAVPAPTEPGQRPVADLLTDLQKLYRQTERATETYNSAAEQLTRQRAEVARLNADLARARLALHDSRGDAGRLAREQYQGSSGALSPYLRLLLARDPQRALDEGHVIGQLARERAGTLGRLAGSEKRADELAREARKALDTQLALAQRQRRARDDVQGRLHEVERLLASLSTEQLTALAEFERNGTAEAQRKLLASGAIGDDRPPTEEGQEAVGYAVRQVGKPYQWGAAGPKAYDCSGLTSQAWQHAGTAIPRTSQQQWARLKRIPLNELRPGDLVVYFPEATHVALYLGDGMVVQAPRPGAKVTVSPVAAAPVLGAVRPDPGGKPLAHYTPVKLPAGALNGPDTGLYAAGAPVTSAR